jgi:hypothetical protein
LENIIHWSISNISIFLLFLIALLSFCLRFYYLPLDCQQTVFHYWQVMIYLTTYFKLLKLFYLFKYIVKTCQFFNDTVTLYRRLSNELFIHILILSKWVLHYLALLVRLCLNRIVYLIRATLFSYSVHFWWVQRILEWLKLIWFYRWFLFCFRALNIIILICPFAGGFGSVGWLL